jgi:hypothetical protein
MNKRVLAGRAIKSVRKALAVDVQGALSSFGHCSSEVEKAARCIERNKAERKARIASIYAGLKKA